MSNIELILIGEDCIFLFFCCVPKWDKQGQEGVRTRGGELTVSQKRKHFSWVLKNDLQFINLRGEQHFRHKEHRL